MKKLLLLLMLLFLSPIVVSAKKYEIFDTDMSINLYDDFWYVFTRDNLKDNKELEELGLTSDYVYNNMIENDIYLDAIMFYSDIDDFLEVIVFKLPIDGVENLSDYRKKDINELAKKIAEEHGVSDYQTYQNDYLFIVLTYEDNGLYLKKYYTIINGYAYTISFEKTSELDKLNEETMKDIIDTIEFKVDEKSKEKNTKHSTKKNFLDSFADGFLGAGIAFLVLTIVEVIRKKKNKNKDEENR